MVTGRKVRFGSKRCLRWRPAAIGSNCLRACQRVQQRLLARFSALCHCPQSDCLRKVLEFANSRRLLQRKEAGMIAGTIASAVVALILFCMRRGFANAQVASQKAGGTHSGMSKPKSF